MRARSVLGMVAALALLGSAAVGHTAVNVWQQSLPGTTVFSVATAGSDLFVGVYTNSPYGQGVLKSTDGGQTWANVFSVPYAYSLAADYSTPGRVYAATSTGLYRTDDGGFHWTLLKAEIRSSITVSMANPNVLYADNWKSTDGGANWTQMPGLPPIYTNDAHTRQSPHDPNLLYYITSSGPYRTLDGGASWGFLSYGPATFEFDPADAGYLYQGGWMGTNNIRYFPGGSSQYLTSYGAKSLAVDPASHNLVYAMTSAGPFKSTDFGANWAAYNVGGGPGNVPAGSSVFDNTTGKLYAPASAGGLWSVETRGAQTCTDGDLDFYFLEGSLCGTALDCNDANTLINPGMAENCTDGVDNNCNSYTDCADSACSSAPNCQPPPCTTPGVPQNLRATGGKKKVTLNWAASSPAPAKYYRVYRSSSSGGPFSFLANVGPTTLTYTNTGLVTGQTYYYNVKAWTDCDADNVVDAVEESAASNTASARAN